MLRITVDIVPGGFEPLRRHIALMTIANVTCLADRSDYVVEAMEGANPLAGSPPRNTSARINGHDRNQSVWTLVAKAAAVIAEAESDPL